MDYHSINFSQIQIIFSLWNREIMSLVVSICPFVCPSVRALMTKLFDLGARLCKVQQRAKESHYQSKVIVSMSVIQRAYADICGDVVNWLLIQVFFFCFFSLLELYLCIVKVYLKAFHPVTICSDVVNWLLIQVFFLFVFFLLELHLCTLKVYLNPLLSVRILHIVSFCSCFRILWRRNRLLARIFVF